MVDRAIIMTHTARRVFGSYRNQVQILKARLPQRAHGIIRDRGRGEGRGDVSSLRWLILFGIVGAFASGPLLAQDFTQGKSPAQLFAGDCAACHKSPQGLAKSDARSVASFLREHYTTKPEMADALAAYLLASGRASASNDTGRTESDRNGPNRNTDGLRPRAPVGDETKLPDSGEGPKSSAKLRGTGKPTDNEPRRVRSTAAASDGLESTDEKDGAKPPARVTPDAKRDADDDAATETPKTKPRAASREGLGPVPTGKLNSYARSGTSDRDKGTDSPEMRLSKLRAYANSGEAAPPPAISAPPKAVASPPPAAANPPPVVANSPPVVPAPASATPGPSSDGERAAATEEPKSPPEDATHGQSIDAAKPIVDEGPKPPKPRRPASSDGSRSQDGASAAPTRRTDSAANVPTSPMSFLGRILSGSARQGNPN
jgi:hypothetical protein